MSICYWQHIGFVISAQKITQQGRSAAVLETFDFRFICDWLVPEFGDWHASFTANSTSIWYREGSPGARIVSTDNWWEVLLREGVTIGHSGTTVEAFARSPPVIWAEISTTLP